MQGLVDRGNIANIKDEEAYRTIAEVAELMNIKPHVLRFWEDKFITLTPLRRSGGRRYYSPRDIALLKDIQRLLYNEGYTIKAAQKLLSTPPLITGWQKNIKPEAANQMQAEPLLPESDKTLTDRQFLIQIRDDLIALRRFLSKDK